MLAEILAASALTMSAAQSESAQQPAPSPPPSTEELEALLDRHDVPGLSYAQLSRCEVVASRTAGLATLEDQSPVTETTLFEAASLSKPVFAWLVMDLERSGVIDLDRPFADYGFEWPRITDQAAYAQLTPRLVLTHRTGLPNWSGNSLDRDRIDPLEFVRPPNTDHSYSGEAIQLLQAFVEQMTGKSLGTLLHERLSVVMPHSSFSHDYRPGTSVSRGYTAASSPNEGDRDMMPVGDLELAAASLATTSQDYAAFMGMICKGEGLPAESYAEMLRPQTPERVDSAGLPIRWALGWSVVDFGGRPFVVHTGNNGQYRAVAGFFPDNGEGFALLTNGANGTDLIGDFLGLDNNTDGDEAAEGG